MICSARILILKALEHSDRGLFYATVLVFILAWIGNGYLRYKIHAVGLNCLVFHTVCGSVRVIE